MAVHKQRSHQSKKLIELKSKIDWIIPSLGNGIDKRIEGIAQLFEIQLKSIIERPNINQKIFERKQPSKVMHRLKNEPSKYLYLL